MAIEYLGLNAINGPMAVLEGVRDAAYDEIVEMVTNDGKKKLGRIIEVSEDRAVIQVFAGTEGLSLRGVHTVLPGIPWNLACQKRCWGEPLMELVFP